MTKQKNGTWKVSNEEMHDIMICFYEGIEHLEKLGCNSLAEKYGKMYREFWSKDDQPDFKKF